jgi:hypothetical protein
VVGGGRNDKGVRNGGGRTPSDEEEEVRLKGIKGKREGRGGEIGGGQ